MPELSSAAFAANFRPNLAPQRSVSLVRNPWSLSTGISGQFPPESVVSLGWNTQLSAQLRRDPGAIPVLVLISDCRANAARHGGKPLHEARQAAEGIREDGRIRTLVIDTEPEGVTAFGLARQLAGYMGACYYRIEDLHARDIVSAVRSEII